MAADPNLIPLNQARRRIHAAAMKLFAEPASPGQHQRAGRRGRHGARHDLQPRDDVDGLFEEVAAQLARRDDRARLTGIADIDDPAQRLAIGMRQYIRRAHESRNGAAS